jgi:hypothetical protein
MKALGKVQCSVLRALVTNGDYPDSGWLWDTRSNTARILDSLVTRGLAEKTRRTGKYGLLYTKYEVTTAGREAHHSSRKHP